MRTSNEQAILKAIATETSLTKSRKEYKNTKGEIFVYENGNLVEYADTRLIDFHTDRLTNLALNPFQE